VTIEFTILAIPKVSDAVRLNMEEAVAQGKAAVDRTKPEPSSVEPVQEPVDTSISMNNIQSVSDTGTRSYRKSKYSPNLWVRSWRYENEFINLTAFDQAALLTFRFTHTRGAFSPPHTWCALCML
jgi:hypothetical protein